MTDIYKGNPNDPEYEAALAYIIKRHAETQAEIESQIGCAEGYGYCSREYNGKRYRVIVGEVGSDPVSRLREKAKEEAK